MTPAHLNLSTDMSVSLAKSFLKEMAQPSTRVRFSDIKTRFLHFILQEEQLGKSLWSIEHIEKQQEKRNRPAQPVTNV